MTGLSQRRARIVRVRSVEHRVAAARQLSAEKRITDLLGVARRLGDLRASLTPSRGLAGGASLQAMNELQGRLARAEGDLQQPLKQAEDRHEEASTARLLARTREDGAERLRSQAAAAEQYISTLRSDANRPFRVKKGKRK